MKLAPGTQPIINLDELIPLCYGFESEIDVRLKELGMVLKIRRHLTKEERAEVCYPFNGEYLLGTAAAVQQQPEDGKAFLYAIMSRNMWYFGWSDTPDFRNRLDGKRTDGASEYVKINEKREKDRDEEIERLRKKVEKDRKLGIVTECIYPPRLKAPTTTCYLLAKCDNGDKNRIEAKMIIAGYVAYLLGLRNIIRDKESDVGISACLLVLLIRIHGKRFVNL